MILADSARFHSENAKKSGTASFCIQPPRPVLVFRVLRGLAVFFVSVEQVEAIVLLPEVIIMSLKVGRREAIELDFGGGAGAPHGIMQPLSVLLIGIEQVDAVVLLPEVIIMSLKVSRSETIELNLG